MKKTNLGKHVFTKACICFRSVNTVSAMSRKDSSISSLVFWRALRGNSSSARSRSLRFSWRISLMLCCLSLSATTWSSKLVHPSTSSVLTRNWSSSTSRPWHSFSSRSNSFLKTPREMCKVDCYSLNASKQKGQDSPMQDKCRNLRSFLIWSHARWQFRIMSIDFSVHINTVSLELELLGDLSMAPLFETCCMYVGWTVAKEEGGNS